MKEINGYDLSRKFWNFAFDNPEKISPSHCAIFHFAIEHCNRLGWRKKFGFPTMMVCDAVGIKKPSTYIKYFNDLVDWGFFIMIEKSKNQYSANIISLTSALPKKGEALDKAIVRHRDKHSKSTEPINKPINQEPINQEQSNYPFDDFWNLYDKKRGKSKTEAKWKKLTEDEKEKIMKHVPKYVASTPDDQFRKDPLTYLNGKHWEDDIPKPKNDYNPYVDPRNWH